MRNIIAIKDGIVVHVDQNAEAFNESSFSGVDYDSISVDNQKFHVVGDTYDFSMCNKQGAREYAFKNGALYGYTTIDPQTGHVNAAYDTNDQLIHTYQYDDPSCSFYSNRAGGRKKYFVRDEIPTVQRDLHPGAYLACYAEMDGTPNEWYYEFDTFVEMETFASQYSGVSLVPPSLRTDMINRPYWSQSPSIIGQGRYLMSIEGMDNENIISCYASLTPVEAAGY